MVSDIEAPFEKLLQPVERSTRKAVFGPRLQVEVVH